MPTRLVSPVLVARDAEMQALADAVGMAAAGEPSVVLVSGEAGIGKSRLVDEAMAQAATMGVRVLSGRCVEISGSIVPFAPIVDALRTLAADLEPPDLDALLGPARSELARLLPELDPSASPPRSEDATGAGRLFELMFGVIGRLAARSPVALVVEDMQWADRSSLDLIAFMVRALRAERVVVIATYRSDEVHRGHPLRPLLANWERLRSVRRVELRRFEPAHVAEQLTGILGAAPDPGLLAMVVERSEGNAFIAEELVEIVRSGGLATDLPPSLRDVLLARFELLGAAAQEVARTVSAAGRWVTERLLLSVDAQPPDAVFSGLREAVDQHLLVIDQSGQRYGFRHALTRHAVYEDMLPGQRLRLHARYGEALSAEPALAGPDAPLAAMLAHHWASAFNAPRALEASLEAARAAIATYAYAEAQQHLERILELWPQVPDAIDRTGIDLVEVLRLTAVAAHGSGANNRALSLIDAALAELGTNADLVRHAELVERRARSLLELGRYRESIELLEQEAAILPAQPPTTAYAKILAALANVVSRSSEFTSGNDVAQKAAAAARAAGAGTTLGDVLATLGVTRAYQGDGDEALASMRAALDLVIAAQDQDSIGRVHTNMADVLEMFGRHDEAVDVAERGIDHARRVGLVRSTGAHMLCNLAEPLVSLGRWDEAETRLREGMSIIDPSAVFSSGLRDLLGWMAACRGDYDDATDNVRAATGMHAAAQDRQFSQPLALISAEVARARGEVDVARATVDLGLAVDPVAFLARYSWPLVSFGVRLEADEAVKARDRRHAVPDVVDARITSLLELAGTMPQLTPAAMAHAVTVEAEQTRGRGEVDVSRWSEAVGAWRLAGDQYRLGYALWRFAEASCAEGDRAAAGAAAEEAMAVAAGLRATPLLTEVEALVRRARLTLDAVTGPRADVEAEDALGRFGLTDRERQVLALLVEGRRNTEIADSLFISRKTAGVHVSNILGKLGVGSRIEAAALVHRLGGGIRS